VVQVEEPDVQVRVTGDDEPLAVVVPLVKPEEAVVCWVGGRRVVAEPWEEVMVVLPLVLLVVEEPLEELEQVLPARQEN
jgi:hypothetical protein